MLSPCFENKRNLVLIFSFFLSHLVLIIGQAHSYCGLCGTLDSNVTEDAFVFIVSHFICKHAPEAKSCLKRSLLSYRFYCCDEINSKLKLGKKRFIWPTHPYHNPKLKESGQNSNREGTCWCRDYKEVLFAGLLNLQYYRLGEYQLRNSISFTMNQALPHQSLHKKMLYSLDLMEVFSYLRLSTFK